ncbi:MAG: OmpA family protein [Bacteroidales bacterium]|nr:OmpA family protein [Bacteroidales bacterium]
MKGKILMTLFLALASLKMFAQEPETRMTDTSSQFYHYLCDCGCHNHPVNSYSGLNSLRARLADRSWNGNDSINGGHNLSFSSRTEHTGATGMKDNDGNVLSISKASSVQDGVDSKYKDLMAIMGDSSGMDASAVEYITAILKEECPIGTPVYVFFKIGTTQLTDPSQMVNVDAIADEAKRWHLKVRVTGAADSATGSANGNGLLSQSRAEYISKMLQERGVPGEKIQMEVDGGIEKFSPPAVNRHCRVELVL